jgi:ubiquinone/menaquinone biosynthesis C-methylase UbiE
MEPGAKIDVIDSNKYLLEIAKEKLERLKNTRVFLVTMRASSS